MNDYMYEDEIDLLDFLYQVVVKNIVKIIIAGLVCLSVGVFYAKNEAQKSTKIAEALVDNREEALEKYESKDLNKSKLLEVDNYISMVKSYEYQLDYYENSLLRGLSNSSNFYKYSYVLTSDSDNATSIISYIDESLLTSDWLSKVSSELNITNKSKYFNDEYLVQDLFTVDTSYIDGRNGDLVEIELSFIYNNKEKVETVGKQISEVMKKLDVYHVIRTSLKVAEASEVRKAINTEYNDLIALSKSIGTSSKAFNTIQLKYYSILNPVKEIEIGDETIKFGLIGFVVGVFLICLYYGLIYFLNNKLHTVTDLDNYPIKVYGYVGESKGIHKDQIISYKTIESLIDLDLVNTDSKEITFVSTLEKEEIEKIVNDIGIQNYEFKIYGNMFNNDEFVDNCKKDSLVVYIEKTNKTNMSDIRRIIKFNKDYNIVKSGIVISNI